MHYYKRNLGDYYKKAGRLSILQHGVFNLLMDACYDREQFPTLDEAIEWVWASTSEEIEAVEFVLKRFFTLEDGVYVQKRIKEELEEYKKLVERNKQIASDRETKRKEKLTSRDKGDTERVRVVNETPPNHKPITNNHKPITNKHNPPNPPDGGDGCAHDQSDQKPPDHKPPKVNYVPFDDFWKIYPLKQGRDRAEKSWIKLKPDKTLYNKIILNIDRRLLLGEWSLDRKNFIPHASTYLNQKRWNDEVIARGEQHAAHQPNNQQYRLSTVERVNQNLQRKSDERRRMLESGELVLNQDGTVVPANGGVVLPQMGQQLWDRSDP